MHLSEIKQRYHEQLEAGETPNSIPYTKASITRPKQQSSQAPSEESESEEERTPKEVEPRRRGIRRKESIDSPKEGSEVTKRRKRDSSDDDKGSLDTSSSKSTSPSSLSEVGDGPQIEVAIPRPPLEQGEVEQRPAPAPESSMPHMEEDHSGAETNNIVASFLNLGAAMDHPADHLGETPHDNLHSAHLTQPFAVSVSPDTLIYIEVHGYLSPLEAKGGLGGIWDPALKGDTLQFG